MTRETVLHEGQPASQEKPSAELVSPYGYDEFAGPAGERYLKKLLRQILPAALYRTWEIFVEHQARGNDCYLSISQLATLAGRSLRTIQKDLAHLLARQLLVERAVRKAFRQTDGHNSTRMVVVKDFTALYTLAHEYHEWLQCADYIPAQRAFLSALSEAPTLVAKLRRFNNYRRVLYTHQPGPARVSEEDRWFTEYRSDARGTDEQRSCSSHKRAEKQAKEMSKDSPKRLNESSQRDEKRGDSCDSASAFSDGSWRRGEEGSAPRCHQPTTSHAKKTPEGEAKPFSQQPSVWAEHHPPCRRYALSLTEQGETSQTRQAAREAMAHAKQRHTQQHLRSRQASGESVAPPRPPDHPLARSFLHEIVVPFGDRNAKGSVTRILSILANASLEEAEVLLCLVRAYTVARDTRLIRSTHCDPKTGQVNRMPLFCTLFERFVQARLHNGTWNYSWQQLEDDLAADDRLLLWWTKHQALLAQTTPASSELSLLGAPDASPKEQGEEQEGPSDSVVGWARREAAQYWGEHLLEALIAAGYEAEVRVHLERQSYQLLFVGYGNEWVLSTPQMVQEAIRIIQNPDDNQ